MFTKRAGPCDGACDDERGWQRLLTDLAAGPSSTGRLVRVLSQPVGAEPQWPRGRLDAVWREGVRSRRRPVTGSSVGVSGPSPR